MKKVVLVCGLGAVVSGLGACSAADDPEPEVVSAIIEPIIGGVAATEYPEAAILNMKSASGSYACTATLIAPKVVLTAGHCVDGLTSWDVYVGGAMQTSTSAETYDWKENGATTVNPAHHDLGLVYLTNPIVISAYPTLAQAALPTGSTVTNVGRIKNGVLTSSVWKANVSIQPGSLVGYPFDYSSTDVIEHGDSGGPVFALGTHSVVAVNSGAGGNTQVLARVDLLLTWIQGKVATHGGFASSGVVDAGVKPSDAGLDAKASDASADVKVSDASADVKVSDASADAKVSDAAADAKASDSGGGVVDAGAPKCTSEVEPNDVFAKANALGALQCGSYATSTDVDYYSFTAPIGTTKVTLTGLGSFTIGYVSATTCLPMLTGQTAVSVTVTGAPRALCLSASNPTKALGTYTLTRN